MRQVIRAIETDGFREARLLLQDWMIVVLQRYLAHYGAHPENITRPDEMCEAIAPLPQHVYGLLRGALLSSNTPLSTHALSAADRTCMYAPPRRPLRHATAAPLPRRPTAMW